MEYCGEISFDTVWSYLPDNIILSIFEYLNPRSLLNASQDSLSCIVHFDKNIKFVARKQGYTDSIIHCQNIDSWPPSWIPVKTCKTWHRLALDEFLWKDLLFRGFKINRNIGMAPGKMSWLSEFKRLKYHVPMIESEVMKEHKDQVLHVSFSHNGDMFATTSKDGFVKVWNSSYPCTLKYYADMKEFTWKYTQFSQFNDSDTLLLVSGVHFGLQSTTGEIAVFSLLSGFELQCRVLNKPYDIFGAWYDNGYLLSGDLRWRGNFTSSSLLWLNKASQALESEHETVVKRLYNFLNSNASSVRTVMISRCPDSLPGTSRNTEIGNIKLTGTNKARNSENQGIAAKDAKNYSGNTGELELNNKSCDTIEYDHKYRMVENELNVTSMCCLQDDGDMLERLLKDHNRCSPDPGGMSDFECDSSSSGSIELDSYLHVVNHSDPDLDSCKTCKCEECNCLKRSSSEVCSCGDSSMQHALECVENGTLSEQYVDKYLIFTMGEQTYTPHQIGIKRITATDARNIFDGMKKHDKTIQSSPPENNPNDDGGHIDDVDHTIEMNGHIIGMCLSPDHRYLYVNTRSWPENYTINDPLNPPPISQQIDIHVIDMATLQEVGNLLRSHKAFTPNDECFFIFLDVCAEYIASGAEDKQGYMWDRHYGICLNYYPHNDVVNSVAFNPKDSEMFITVSDDNSIKIWRSRNRQQQLKGHEDQCYTTTAAS